jgi:Mg-chelatase subunit ChlD
MTEYVENMSFPDTGAVVHFASAVTLMNPLTNNYNQIKNDLTGIPPPGGSTYMGEAMQAGINEIITNGQSGHLHVIILLTDGDSNGAMDPVTVAQTAADNNILIYTIGLGPGANNVLLKLIADITGAKNFTAQTAEDLRGIYQLIYQRCQSHDNGCLTTVDRLYPWFILHST